MRLARLQHAVGRGGRGREVGVGLAVEAPLAPHHEDEQERTRRQQDVDEELGALGGDARVGQHAVEALADGSRFCECVPIRGVEARIQRVLGAAGPPPQLDALPAEAAQRGHLAPQRRHAVEDQRVAERRGGAARHAIDAEPVDELLRVVVPRQDVAIDVDVRLAVDPLLEREVPAREVGLQVEPDHGNALLTHQQGAPRTLRPDDEHDGERPHGQQDQREAVEPQRETPGGIVHEKSCIG